MSDFINTVDIIGDEALTNSIIDRSITEYKDNNVTSLGKFSFAYCKSLTTVDVPKVITIGSEPYYSASSVFYGCSALTKLILRSTTMVTMIGSNSLGNTPIEINPKNGYIYVPRTLIEGGYKTAKNWSTYANQFRALEDYTVDGTITGALDESKI